MQNHFSLTTKTAMKSIHQNTFGAVLLLLMAASASAEPFIFSTGAPDEKIATLSRPATSGQMQTETADDFVTTQAVVITQATFTGLLSPGASPAEISGVEVELYHVFPRDSALPPTGNVLLRPPKRSWHRV
jgi:hypothetical protein